MSTEVQSYPLRPFMPVDTMALRDLFAQSIEELTADDYTEDQRLAWIARAEDAEAFADRLEAMVTLIVQVDGFRYHREARERRRDIAHDARLVLLGYTVLRFDYAQVLFGWAEVEHAILLAVAQGLHRAR